MPKKYRLKVPKNVQRHRPYKSGFWTALVLSSWKNILALRLLLSVKVMAQICRHHPLKAAVNTYGGAPDTSLVHVRNDRVLPLL